MKTTYRIGYLVGSLSSTSINRRLALVLAQLAPPDLVLDEIPIRDLPLDPDSDYPPSPATDLVQNRPPQDSHDESNAMQYFRRVNPEASR